MRTDTTGHKNRRRTADGAGGGRTVDLKCTITEAELDELEARVAARGTDVSQEVRRALHLKTRLDQVRAAGGRVLIWGDGEWTELVTT